MDGYIQTTIGIAVSIILFWLSYRQTIGAKKERTKNANESVHTSIMRRMVLEDYTPKYKDITRVLEGKAREYSTTANDMLSEEQVLNSVYTEVFNSDLISPDQRVKIESKLDQLFKTIEEKPVIPTFQEFEIIKEQQKRRKETLVSLTLAVSMVGALSSILFSFIKNPSALIQSNQEWLISGLGVFITSIAMISFLSFFKREKDESNNTVTRSSTIVSAVMFENEIAKIIEKSGYEYKTEPKIGRFSPDFLIDYKSKKIAVEVKAWKEDMPLYILKTTIQRLEELSEEENINEVILVIKNSRPVKGIMSENTKVKIYNINEFYKYLNKNKRKVKWMKTA